MERQAITVRGVVQGVGFRPFVYGLAIRLHLNGFVRNETGSVLIEVEGGRASLNQFLDELQMHPPPLSQIDNLESRELPAQREHGFRIEASEANALGEVIISPDVGICANCLAELFDPSDRRYHYPFLNCTNCGPRLTIVEGAPYDRERTTMAHFTMCPACRAEYENPSDRRFHAQPTACPECGPGLMALQPDGERIPADDPLAHFAEALLHGGIGALKGLGGFHLVCLAGDEESVNELRKRKHRDEKPFAIMVRDFESAACMCEIGLRERERLESPQRPVVLLRKRLDIGPDEWSVAECVAPGNPFLGVMLPYTPLHHLVMEAVGDVPLVMTSGNRSNEPIVFEDVEASERLGDIVDVILTHTRPIRVRCDDSVTRIVNGSEILIRRSRGYAPQPIKIPFDCPCPMLAVGGQFKGVFALARERHAFLSHHLGDLDNFSAYTAFERDVALYEKLFEIQPTTIVHDLHPDYASTGYARRRAERENLETFVVQHHHAHMASCMAEHGLDEPVIGVVFDGTGYGMDDAIWGGEFLVGDYFHVSRAAHLRYVRLPGGDKAIREPWRVGVSHLVDAGCREFAVLGAPLAQRRAVEQMIYRGFQSPFTSSVGRLFDAVAAIAGVRSLVSYEGQAAMQLEWLATDVKVDGAYPFLVSDEVDTRPLIRAVVDDLRRDVRVNVIARRFHSTIIEMIHAVCERIRIQTKLETVVLSGGVFLNALLTSETCSYLTSHGFRVYRHEIVPPSDGGLCLGQLAVAAKSLQLRTCITRYEQTQTLNGR